ncbi:DUF2231 domain-containing protein [Peredibacter sp. HCB2-198]|uniref:DUF2231 domain-containing protein n=1 Tax=Peredibacter sp. HCB2-198 TaxID=3383025 RepID=UPI0038B5083C
MHVPFHPMIAHFPMALTFILPVLILVFAYMIRINKMTPRGWLIIVGLQLVVTITGYVALESGETEEHTVSKVVAKDYIHEHEEAAEIFVGSTVIALVVSIGAFFLRKELQLPIKAAVAVISLVSCYLAYRTGTLGGELVYKYGAASAYAVGVESQPEGILPTPGLNTSESPMPVDENESLKADDNDYGTGDESESDDEVKQED